MPRLALFALALLAAPAFADEPAPASPLDDEVYDRAVDLIDRLFLYPDRVTAGTLLQSAALGLADQIHWLVAEPDGTDGVVLKHGDGAIIGAVTVASMETLPAALRALEQVVTDSGYDTGDVDVRLEELKAMTLALDRYSRVLAGDRLDRFDVRLMGTLVGVGATITRQSADLKVTDIVAGGPAQIGGLRIGDAIVRIDGVSTVNMDVKDATDRIRGEVDTPISVTVRRGANELIDLVLTRAEIVVPNVTSQVLGDGIGYVNIDHFSQRTVDNLLGEMAKLRAAGALSRGLVIDLRGDTGGSMKEAARSADQFLTDGLLLRTEGPDGQHVQNLQARMDATRDGNEPSIPIVVLIDDQTASGAEILAGALFELDRAVLIGYPSYGKGTVQKIYPLDDDVKLKLTVAQYVLEHDRKIADGGLVPDAVLGRVDVTSDGVRYRGWEERAAKVPWEQVVPVVYAGDAEGRVRSQPRDFAVELARRTVLRAETPCLSGAIAAEKCATREATLKALDEVLPELRADQQSRLVVALSERGIDWSPPAAPADPAAASVPLQATAHLTAHADPSRPGAVQVTVDVANLADQPLSQALVEIECDTFDPWSGLVVPVGRVDPGATGHGTVELRLPPGVERREDTVRLRLRAADRPPIALADQVLQAASPPPPRIAADLRMIGTGPDRKAEVTIENLGTTALANLDLSFAYPGNLGVELIDSSVHLASIPVKGKATADLALRFGPNVPASVPLELDVDPPEGGPRLAQWPVSVATDGSTVRVEAPRITFRGVPLSAATGSLPVAVQIADDRAIDHVVVYANGNKIAWAGAAKGGKLDLKPAVDLEPGNNRITVVVVDDQGVTTRKTVVIRAEATGNADATEP